MKQTLFILSIMVTGSSIAQIRPVDTMHAKETIRMVDSIENTGTSVLEAIVERRAHNETQWSERFLYDSISQQIFRCEFVTLTIQRNDSIWEKNDSLLERTSFYHDDTSIVASIFRNYRNSKLLDSTLIFLNCRERQIGSIFPYEDVKGGEIKCPVDVWLEEKWFKDLLQKNEHE